MARVNSRDKLREYIKRSLGAPITRVELTEEQLDDCIDRAIELFAEYAYDGGIDSSLLLNLEKGVLDYKLPYNVVAITGLSVSSSYSLLSKIPAGYVLDLGATSPSACSMPVTTFDVQSMSQRMAAISNVVSMFDVRINYSFHGPSKTLRFHEQPDSNVVLLELSLEYIPEEIDEIYNDQWIKKRAVAEAWLVWAAVTGKYSSQLINGSEFNYSDMLSKGESGIQATNEELDGLREPLGVFVF